MTGWIILAVVVGQVLVMSVGAYVIWRLMDRSSPATEFPEIDDGVVLFHAKRASGKLLGGVAEVFSGVNGCLSVTVTDRELWLAGSFPMSVVVRYVGMEHRVPLSVVSSVEPEGRKSAVVVFEDSDGEPRRVRLVLRERNGFLEAISSRIGSAGNGGVSG